jgi:hypothetical protein
MRTAIYSVAILALSTGLAGIVQADTIATLTDTAIVQDTTLFGNKVSNGGGGSPGLFVADGGSNAPLPNRALIEFNVAGNIPAGSTITSAKLTMILGQVGGGGGGGNPTIPTTTIDLFRVADSWGEGTAQTQAPASDNLATLGGGAAATPSDATWNNRFFSSPSSITWTTPGGDFAGTASANLDVGTTLGSSNTWLSTAALVADVQLWLDSPSTNFGWILKSEDESTQANLRGFYSRQAATASNHPVLTISYVPEPSSFVLSALALSALIAAQRRRG